MNVLRRLRSNRPRGTGMAPDCFSQVGIFIRFESGLRPFPAAALADICLVQVVGNHPRLLKVIPFGLSGRHCVKDPALRVVLVFGEYLGFPAIETLETDPQIPRGLDLKPKSRRLS